MPEIEYAFLADAADAKPGEKFNVLGGGVSRIAGPAFPLVHPHLALVCGIVLSATEVGRDHQVRFALLSPDGREVASADGGIRADGATDGRDTLVTFAIDLWSLTFPVPGDYSFRLLLDGSERKRIPLLISAIVEPAPPGERRFDA